jgi:hypothetical protein
MCRTFIIGTTTEAIGLYYRPRTRRRPRLKFQDRGRGRLETGNKCHRMLVSLIIG